MKFPRTNLAVFVCSLVLTCGILSSTALAQTTINVPADQTTIQAAINAANSGDTVLVAPGTYAENINFNGKAITVTSSGGASATIIDGSGNNSVVSFHNSETLKSVLNGFTLQNGKVPASSIYDGGGISIFQASPTITNNVIQQNYACGAGGGIYVDFGSALIQGNTIQNNSQANCSGGIGGGGIAVGGAASAQVIGNVIRNNTWPSGDGGGISLFAAGTPTIQNNTISGNIATGVSPAAQGGGIYIVNSSDALIVQNAIYANTAGQGSGVYLGVPSGNRGPIFVNNTIIGGTGSNQGSAVYVTGFSNQVQFSNNLLIGPSGQNAVYCDPSYSQQPPSFNNNDAFSPNGTGLTGTCANLASQNGNLSVDPQFVDANADYHLQLTSSAIDAGNNSLPNLPTKDIAGNPRILDGNNDCISTIDIGVYEFSPTLAPANVSFSPTQVTFADTVIGTSNTAAGAVTLTNTGGQCFQFSNTQITGDFSQASTCSSVGLQGNSSCSYSLTFTPTTNGTRTGVLTVTGTSSGTPQTVNASLSGKGLTPPAVSFSPASLNFPSQLVNTSSTAQTVTMSNTGDAGLSITSITITGPFTQTNTCGNFLPGDIGNCSIRVVFTPTQAGAASGIITIVDNASGSPHIIPLTGTGTQSVAHISFVQASTGPSTIQSLNSSVAVAFSKAQTASDLNIVAIGWGDTTSTIRSVTDTRGNIYTLAVGPTVFNGLQQVIYYAKNIAGGSNTVTVTFNQRAAYPDVRILEYSGLDTSNPRDALAVNTGAGTTANSGSATTTSANELIFASGTTTTTFSSAGAGFTGRILNIYGNIAEDKIVSSAGSYNATAALHSSAWIMQMVTFRAKP